MSMNFTATGRSKDYGADVGFTDHSDTNELRSYIEYETDRDTSKAIIYKEISNENSLSFDWLGRSQNWASKSELVLALHRQTGFKAGVQFGYERVFEHEFGAK